MNKKKNNEAKKHDKVNEGTIVRLCKQYIFLSCVFDEHFI